MPTALSNTPVCVPYRASLLTGINCAHLDVKSNPDMKKFKDYNDPFPAAKAAQPSAE